MNARRRGQGEGLVRQREDGRWEARLDLGWQNGRRVRKSVYGRTRAEVATKLREAQDRAAKNLPLPDERRLTGDYLRWWGSEVLPGTVKDSTADDYRWLLEHYVLPHLERVPLARLGPPHVHSLQTKLAEAGYANRTIRYARAVLRRALRDAERWGLITRNPVPLVDAPRIGPAKTDDVLTPEEATALLEATRGHRLEALITVALAVGLRRGEALALRWSDLDLEAGMLTVRGTLKRRRGHGLVIDRPKTAESAATVPLPGICTSALLAHRQGQREERLVAGSLWQENHLVFSTAIGTPLDPNNVTKIHYALCERAGIGRRRFHALRHSAATLMHEQGVPLELISATLRHSGLAITKDVYVTFRPALQRRAAEAMDELLGPQRGAGRTYRRLPGGRAVTPPQG